MKTKVSRITALRLSLIALIAIVPITWVLWVAHAATRTWTGNGGNNLWTNAANWSGGLVAPSDGDDLVFPSSIQANSVNRFAIGTTFNSISVSGGHSMTGNSISLNAGITATNSTIGLSSIKLNFAQTFTAPATGFGPLINSAIDNNGNLLLLDGPGNFQINGIISGAGNLTKFGTGTTVLTGNNLSFTGATSIFQGTLLVFGSQPNSLVLIRGAILGGSGTVGLITFGGQGGSISPGAANNGTGILTVNGNASFPTASSVSGSFDVDLNSTTLGTGYDQLKVNGTVTFGDGANNALNVNLGFAPQPGTTFTIIDNDGTDAVSGIFAGKPEGSTFTVNGTTFRITYQGGTDANDVVLTAISGMLSFTAASFTAQEGLGAANITLSRTGGGNTTAVAKVTLADVTTSPADYRFSPGALDQTFDPGSGTSSAVITTALQPDGKIIIGGNFTSPRNHIARLNADGTLDGTFDPGSGTDGSVITTALQPDGKIIIGGLFTSPRNHIARLNADGSLDTTFNLGSGANDAVNTTVLQPDGTIIIGGAFTSYGGKPRNRIARLDANGIVDLTFDPGSGTDGAVITTAVQANGKIIIGGNFTSPRNHIARLNANGSLDGTFDPGSGANGDVWTTAVQADGKIILGGNFTSPRNHIARLDASGSLDGTFDPGSGANAMVRTTALQADGKIIIGGSFTFYNGSQRRCIARLNANGGLDNTFDPGSGANVTVSTVRLQPDGKIILVGFFTSYNGITRNRIARVDGDLFATWGPNDFTNKTITLHLVSDGLVEDGSETLSLTLVPLTGAIAGSPSSAMLTITDPIVRTWNGSTTNRWAVGANWDGGGIPGAGDDLVFPPGAARLFTFNDFPAGTTFNSITFSAPGYELAGNGIALTAGITRVGSAGSGDLVLIDLKLNANQTFSTPTGANLLFKNIDTNGRTLTLDGAGRWDLNGAITGTGGLIFNGSGLIQITGANPNTFSGPTVVNSGMVQLIAAHPNSQLQVNGGEFFGLAAVNSIVGTGGIIHPQFGGTMSSTGNVNLGSGVTFDTFIKRDAGSATSATFLVGGNLNLGNCTLTVTSNFQAPPTNGDTFKIIDKTGGGLIPDTFKNLPEGTTLLIGGYPFRISYVGGNGNDVVLTLLPPMLFIEEGTSNRALALDSVTFVRGPFPIVTDHNFSADHHTRVILFTSKLDLTQPDPSLLTVQAAGFNLLVENVGSLSGTGMEGSFIIVRLPDGLPSGDLPIVFTLRGVMSNTAILTISP